METNENRILLNISVVDATHILLKWYGLRESRIMIFNELSSIPIVTLNWYPQEYLMTIDENGHSYRIVGVDDLNVSNIVSVGKRMFYGIDCDVLLPYNEKIYFIDIDLISEFRIEDVANLPNNDTTYYIEINNISEFRIEDNADPELAETTYYIEIDNISEHHVEVNNISEYRIEVDL